MHTPIRTCIVCRKTTAQRELVRVIKSKDDNYYINSSPEGGRSLYVCKNNDCITKCIQKKHFNKRFSATVPQEIYDKLLNLKF